MRPTTGPLSPVLTPYFASFETFRKLREAYEGGNPQPFGFAPAPHVPAVPKGRRRTVMRILRGHRVRAPVRGQPGERHGVRRNGTECALPERRRRCVVARPGEYLAVLVRQLGDHVARLPVVAAVEQPELVAHHGCPLDVQLGVLLAGAALEVEGVQRLEDAAEDILRMVSPVTEGVRGLRLGSVRIDPGGRARGPVSLRDLFGTE